MLIATIRQSTGRYAQVLYVIAVVMFCSAVIPLFVRPPYTRREPLVMPRVA